jgi:23S rRNA (cytosine1962-C5)-methyltransferase
MKRIIMKSGEDKRIRLGHPWVYDNEIAAILAGPGDETPVELVPGETADVESSRKEYLGRAICNPKSKIVGRIYSPSKEGLDKGFFKRRIREALARRRLAGFDLLHDSFRLLYAEADGVPGLIADCFTADGAAYVSLQFLSFGMDQRKADIVQAFTEVFSQESPALPHMRLGALIDKPVADIREKEGLPPASESILYDALPQSSDIIITENGCRFAVNLSHGQKTGYFLDQRVNRRLASDACTRLLSAASSTSPSESAPFTILDACCYSGSFGVQIAAAVSAAGAIPRVTFMDASARALDLARRNASLNGLDSAATFTEADVKDALHRAARAKDRYDAVILDPPAFAKTKDSLENAMQAYHAVNTSAISLVRKGGVFVTCSCSQAVSAARFRRMLTAAASAANRRLRQLSFTGASPDHPVLLGYDESEYLKCGVYIVE